MTTKRIARTLDLSAFRGGADAGLASVAAQAATACAVQSTLEAIQAVNRVAGEVRLSAEVRLHYLRCVRLNLAAVEDRLAGLDDIEPCVAEKLGDIAHAIHHAAANPED